MFEMILKLQIGSFKGSLNPNTKNFSEFKKYIKKNIKIQKNNNIAIFCTGGIRCEKASAYMKKEGFKNVFQLKGGILQYLEDTHQKILNGKGNVLFLIIEFLLVMK